MYACQRCGDVPVKRFRIPQAVQFVFSWQTQCVRCGTKAVRLLPKRDGIDSASHHPLRMLMGLTGAPWRHCDRCRLQYRDWRNDAASTYERTAETQP